MGKNPTKEVVAAILEAYPVSASHKDNLGVSLYVYISMCHAYLKTLYTNTISPLTLDRLFLFTMLLNMVLQSKF
jgi:hypothetical protein